MELYTHIDVCLEVRNDISLSVLSLLVHGFEELSHGLLETLDGPKLCGLKNTMPKN